jgi:hypothetical protein
MAGGAGSRYIEVPREALTGFLEAKGFQLDPTGRGELVYARTNHNHPHLKVKVYTSLPLVGGDVRGLGKDAIRVCAVYEPPSPARGWGIGKEPRVYRTGSVDKVLARMLERMQEAYGLCNSYAKKHCPGCGAPTWPDSGKCLNKSCETRQARRHVRQEAVT